MSVTDFRPSLPNIIVATAVNSLAIGGVTISSNAAGTDGWVLVATGSNSMIWRNALAFGSNTNDIGPVGTMGASSSNSRADHVHRGVGSITTGSSNTLYGALGLTAGTGIAITTNTGTGSITIASSGLGDSEFVKVRDGGDEAVATANVSGAYTVDLANGNWQDLTLTGDATFTFSGATNNLGDSFVLILRQDGTGGRTVTWPGAVVWPGGSAPTATTTASSTEVYTFFTRDGDSTWYGFIAGGGTSVASPSFASNSFAELSLTADASMAITAPTSSSLLLSAPFQSEVVTDSDEIVWHGGDVVHSLVRLY